MESAAVCSYLHPFVDPFNEIGYIKNSHTVDVDEIFVDHLSLRSAIYKRDMCDISCGSKEYIKTSLLIYVSDPVTFREPGVSWNGFTTVDCGKL
jgi:hypothetical protein